MRISILSAFLLLAVASPAFALTIDKEASVNTDGTAKFSDPDEQQPDIINVHPVAPEDRTSSSSKPGLSFSMAPNSQNGAGNPFSPHSSAPDAFDQAYGHK